MVEVTWRIRRSDKLAILACLPVFLAGGALGLVVALADKSIPHRLAAGLLIAGVPFGMAGLTALTLLAYQRLSGTIGDGWVTDRGPFRETQIALAEVTAATWSGTTSDGTLKLRTDSARIVIPFAHVPPDERERVVAYLRSSLPPEFQTGWNVFAYRSERAKDAATRTKPRPDEILVRRSRYDRLLLPCVLAFTIIGAVGWRLTGNPGQLIVGPAMLLALWGALRFSVPAQGQIQPRLSLRSDSEVAGGLLTQSEIARRCVFMLVWGVIAMAIVFGIDALRPRLTYPDTTMLAAGVVWFAVLMGEMVRQDRRDSRRLRERADLAAKLRGEPGPGAWPGD